VAVTVATRNSNLIPTVILLGSFLIPFVVTLFAAERIRGINALQLVLAFAVEGICGVLGASLLEADLRASVWMFIVVGFIEELVKGAILLLIGWRVMPKSPGQGALLGATVGAGFAAFESAGYAFNAVITAGGLDIVSLVQTEILRALLSPLGHVLWTGILGAVIFGAARNHPRSRLSWAVPIAFIGVALLHAFWDSLGEIASGVALLTHNQALQYLHYDGALPPSLAAEVSGSTQLIYILGVVLVSLLGVGSLLAVFRSYAPKPAPRLAANDASPSEAPASPEDPLW
jgi:RsiW-degrading membrane proteinase PrsW (M82 family)